MSEKAFFWLTISLSFVVVIVALSVGSFLDGRLQSPTLEAAVSVLDQSPEGSRVLLVAGRAPQRVSEAGGSSSADGVASYERADIVSIGATLGLTSQPGSECAIRDGARICLKPLAGEPVLTLERSEGGE